MPKVAQFNAYDLRRKNPHKLPSPPRKITTHQLSGEWAEAHDDIPAGRLRSGKVRGATRGRVVKSKKKAAPKLPKRALDVLKVLNPYEETCLHCGECCDDKDCGAKCYREFKKQFVATKIDMRGPGPLGYMAYTKPRVHLAKGEYLDEYIGELRPIGSDIAHESMYCFEVPNRCVIDSGQAGNWTRFINSSCRPNVSCVATTIGGRHVIVFQADRDIGPEEELTFCYGPDYFKNAGFLCACSARKKPHTPRKER